MTREEAINHLKTVAKTAIDSGYDSAVVDAVYMAVKAIEQEPCVDCISRQAVDDAIYDYSRSCDVNYGQIMEYIDKIPPVAAKPKTQATSEIDNFVSFLIRENCEGCKECEPRLSADWKPKFACVEEGRAKWLLSMAEKYKAESEGENDN